MSIPWFEPKIGDREKQFVIDVLDSNYINDGDITRKFEKKVSEYLGVKHCIALSNGTSAIALSLMGMGIGLNSEVIVPDFTFIATANAVRLAGAEVKLVDIDPISLTINIKKLIKAISSRTRAIIPVDVNGRGANYNELLPIAKEYGLIIICDSAEAFGSRYKGRLLGTFGDAGCFSFSPNKTITTGQGGMIATNNSDLYYRIRELKDQGRRYQGTGGDDIHPAIGYNFKLTNLQSAIGLAQLERLPERLEKAKQRDKWYREFLKKCSFIKFPPIDYEGGELLQWTDILTTNRKEIIETMSKAEIGCRAFWHPIHKQLPYKNQKKRFDNSSNVSQTGLWLPSCFDLTEENVEYISQIIKNTI